MSDNLDTALSTLATEINALDAQGKGIREQVGHKLIAVRELLREKYGVRAACAKDALGLHPPKGWAEWCKQNLTMRPTYAAICIRIAVDPEKERIRQQKHNATADTARSATLLRYLNRIWPNISSDDRERVMTRVIELAKEMP